MSLLRQKVCFTTEIRTKKPFQIHNQKNFEIVGEKILPFMWNLKRSQSHAQNSEKYWTVWTTLKGMSHTTTCPTPKIPVNRLMPKGPATCLLGKG